MNAKICTESMQILDLLLCDLVGGSSTVWNGFAFFCGVLVLLVDLSVRVTSPLTTFFLSEGCVAQQVCCPGGRPSLSNYV